MMTAERSDSIALARSWCGKELSSFPRLLTEDSIEEELAKIWAQVLGVQQVGIYDNFFALGGHSLRATQVVSRLHASLRMEVSLHSLFKTPTIAGLAATIVQKQKEQTDSAVVARLLEELEQ